jgi:uncharacterized membrane protein
MNLSRLYAAGFLLIVTGIGIVVLGTLSSTSTSVSLGGAVFIGPFPIVFGSGPGSWLFALTALIIAAVMVVVVTFYLSILLRRGRGET